MDSSITATDGTPIRVSESGPPPRRADATVVLAHGVCLNRAIWAPQILHLRRQWPNLHIVTYDHRGHGESGTAPARTYTVDQLADDLDSVIRTTAADGPVITIGHSMGGMTVLSHFARHPQTAARIAGTALISTSAGNLTDTRIGWLLGTPAVPLLGHLARRAPAATGRAWSLARQAAAPLIGAPCSSEKISATAAIAEAVTMITNTDAATIAGFLAGLRDYDGTDGLDQLAHRRIPTAVLCGTRDVLTPCAHAQRIADAAAGGRVTTAPGAQHMLGLERPHLVATALDGIIASALTPAAVPA